MKFSAEALLAILNDILDFSKIEAGKLELETHQLLGAGRGRTRPSSRSRSPRYQNGVELIANVAAERSGYLVGDPGKLRQVLANLVGNAVKFTEHGHVLVEVGEARREGSRRCFTCSCRTPASAFRPTSMP